MCPAPISEHSSSVASTAESDDDETDTAVMPSPRRQQQVFNSSTQYWNELVQRAHLMSMERNTVQLDSLLHRLPSLPDDLTAQEKVTGFATWQLSTECNCDLSVRHGETHQILLASPSNRPTLCFLSNRTVFDYKDAPLNGVTLIFLAWSYILTMNLLERQGLAMEYSDHGPRTKANMSTSELYLGKSSTKELRWWRAITQPGQGWRPRGRYPPWTIAFQSYADVTVTADEIDESDPRDSCPPSSQQAACFLEKFVSRYDLDAQSSLAFAMVLSLPLYNQMNYSVWLPPISAFRHSFLSARTCSASKTGHIFENISRFMTLSINPRFLSSALWGIFWEQDVDCNLVSAWCEPIIRATQPLIRSGNIEVLAHALALRRPNIATLWYGILATGSSKISQATLNFLKTLQPPVPSRPLAEVAAWTGSPQSFMDVRGFGPYLKDGQVERADVWRLRFECSSSEDENPSFTSQPLCAWQPFGAMYDSELELCIRPHIQCKRHEWTYLGWTWTDSPEVLDEGICSDLIATESEGESRHTGPETLEAAEPFLCEDLRASIGATGEIFRWGASEMEISGGAIYAHSWVRAMVDFEMED